MTAHGSRRQAADDARVREAERVADEAARALLAAEQDAAEVLDLRVRLAALLDERDSREAEHDERLGAAAAEVGELRAALAVRVAEDGELRGYIARLEADLVTARSEQATLVASRSWRVTRPLRRLSRS